MMKNSAKKWGRDGGVMGAFRIMRTPKLFWFFFQFGLQVEGFLGENYINLLKNAQKKWGRDGGGPHYGYKTSEARLTHFFGDFFKSGFRL